jgi:myo-inositol-1(or 4)-monophosphatase
LPAGDSDIDRAAADHADVRDRLATAVREGGALALQTFRGPVKSWIKDKTSPVSEADLAVDALLRDRLTAIRNVGWLSEETEDDPARLAETEVWVVDPIDGTRAYLAGREDWCVSVALVAGATPVLAAVFAPATDEFFFAIRSKGTTRNERPVRAAGGTELDFSRMAGPKPLVQRLSPSPDEITLHPRIGSLALRLCRVADGSLDAAFAGGQSRDWDLAAANLIVQEANGRMTALSGDAIEYNRREVVHGVLVAAGHDRHARIVEHFRDHRLP